MAKYLTISELRMDDKVIPLSSDNREVGKTFIVTDLHPTLLLETRTKPAEYATVAVSLWEYSKDYYGPGHDKYGRDHTSHTALFQLVERRWGN